MFLKKTKEVPLFILTDIFLDSVGYIKHETSKKEGTKYKWRIYRAPNGSLSFINGNSPIKETERIFSTPLSICGKMTFPFRKKV